MPSPSTFWPEALPYAKQAKAAVPSLFLSVILSQWGIETAYGGEDWSPNNNPGNVGSFDGRPVATFPTLQEGVAAYVQTIEAGYYAAVRAATTWRAQAVALGESPWASAHYEASGGGPGSALVDVIETYDLTQFDDPPPAPPSQEENDTVTALEVGGQLHVWGVVNNVAYHWWQTVGGNPAGQPEWYSEKLPV